MVEIMCQHIPNTTKESQRKNKINDRNNGADSRLRAEYQSDPISTNNDDNNNQYTNNKLENFDPPIQVILEPPSLAARWTCASVFMLIIAVWCKFAFIGADQVPDERNIIMHNGSGYIPIGMTLFYLLSLPLLRKFTEHFLSRNVDVKLLIRESMILYNFSQVLLNGWMVYQIIDGLLFRGHSFVSGPIYVVSTGAPYAVYVHYCDKYLEYLDTYFMILRGKMDQVSFLHIYHHTSIALAWWVGLRLHPAGDIYFGALLNSLIHVMMYSYYTLSLLKISCPWKKYLTMAQLVQFLTVLTYSAYSVTHMPTEANWRHYLGHFIQSFEMISLFVLFLLFFRRTYAKKSPSKKGKNVDGSAEVSTERPSSSDSVSIESKNGTMSLSSGSTTEEIDTLQIEE